ncbi:Variable outer membrane protein (plasmid) [Borrelia crocidurae DOU]|uniref:Variable large protein n=1 Tax=Borrelia crocidurae DOU TaxID=1293575 RepID=W5SRG5_9SPIR|nr:Variable outer membrane protein [Borrelia crocidurae DOU]
MKEKVEEFIGKISEIEEGAKEAATGANGSDAVGNAVKEQVAVPAKFESVNALVKGIKAIVGVVLKENEGDATATKTSEAEKKSIGKLLGKKDDATESVAAAASASLGAVSGADILKAIAKSGEAVNNDVQIANAKNAAEIAAAKKEDTKELTAAQIDAVIAGGIALRAMGKDGKFAANDDKSEHAVKGAAANAVNKVLSTLIMAIRNRVDGGLKEINKVLGEIKEGEGAEVKTN